MLQPQERLRLAVVEGNLPIAKRLLSRFPELWLNIDYENDGWSNLHYASSGGNYLVCFHLITLYNHWQSKRTEFQVSPMDLLAFDQTLVIHLAAENKHIQTLHYLLQEFPGSLWLNAAGGCHRRTPLHLSCISGFQEGIKLLIEYGADPTITDALGNNCLHYLFEYEHVECIWSMHKVILQSAKSKEDAIGTFNKLEQTRNHTGSSPLDYVTTSQYRDQYRKRKEHLLAQDWGLSMLDLTDLVSRKSGPTGTDNSFDNRSESSKSTSASTRASVLSSKFPLLEESRSIRGAPGDDVTLITKRAHSQSLPSDLPQPTALNEQSETRKRSNTTISKTTTPTPHTPTIPPGVYTKPQPPPLKSITISPTVRNSTFTREDHSPPSSPQSTSTTSNSSIYTSSSPSHFRRKYSNNSTFMATPTMTSVPISELRSYSPVVSQAAYTGAHSHLAVTPGSTTPVSGAITPLKTDHAQQAPVQISKQMLSEMIPIFTNGSHISFQPPRPRSMTTSSNGSPASSSPVSGTSQIGNQTKDVKFLSESPPMEANQNVPYTKVRSHTVSNTSLDSQISSSTSVRSSSTLIQPTRGTRANSKISTTSLPLASLVSEASETPPKPSKRNTINSISFSRIR